MSATDRLFGAGTGTARLRPGRVIPLALVLLAVVAYGGYWLGHGARVTTEEVGCLSAEATISCTLGDDWNVSVPLDVAWVDATGAFRDGGRPDCLPPTGRGLEGPVRLSWTDVDVDGMGWRQVLQVECLD